MSFPNSVSLFTILLLSTTVFFLPLHFTRDITAFLFEYPLAMEEKNNPFLHRDHDPEEPSSSSETASSYEEKASASLGFEEEYPSSQTLSSEAGGLEVFAAEQDTVSNTTDEEDNQEDELISPLKPSDSIAHENHMLPTRLDLCLKLKDKFAEEPENCGDEKAQPKSLDGVGRADSETSSVTEAGSGNERGRVTQENCSTQQEGRRVVAMSRQAAADLAKQIIPKVIHLLPACFRLHFTHCFFLFSFQEVEVLRCNRR